MIIGGPGGNSGVRRGIKQYVSGILATGSNNRAYSGFGDDSNDGTWSFTTPFLIGVVAALLTRPALEYFWHK